MDDTSKTQKENESYGKWEQGASLALRQGGSEHKQQTPLLTKIHARLAQLVRTTDYGSTIFDLFSSVLLFLLLLLLLFSCGNEPRTLSPRAYTTLTSCWFFFVRYSFVLKNDWTWSPMTKSNRFLGRNCNVQKKPARCECGVSPGRERSRFVTA